MAEKWRLEGVYFEACNCAALCPCLFASAPTDPDICTVFDHWHIRKGRFGATDLSGLNVVMTVRSPGHMLEVKWSGTLYIDSKADASQFSALAAIFTGKAGGHPALLANHMAELSGVRRAPIAFREDKNRRSVTIPKIAAVTIEALAGQGGKPVTLANHPLAVAPGFPGTGATSSRFKVIEGEETWQFEGRAALFARFNYHGESGAPARASATVT